jgi:ABC-type multidrug transport system fused ATPase/permease subunit
MVPISLAFFQWLIIIEVGYVGWLVMAVFIVALGIQTWIDEKFKQANLKRMAISDQRGRKINEIISGIKVIKFTAWEKIMNNITKVFRTQEGGQIVKAFTLYNFSHSISTMIPTILALLIFTLHDKLNEDKLTIAQIYELITLFNATLTPIRYYIMAVMGQADSYAASARMSTLIQVEQQEPLQDTDDLRVGEMLIKDGNFNWEDEKYHQIFEKKPLDGKKKSNYILKDINVHI